MLQHKLVIATVLITNTLAIGQYAPVIRSKEPFSYSSEYTVASVNKPITQTGDSFQESAGSTTYWLEFKLRPRADAEVTDVQKLVKRMKSQGQTPLGAYSVDSDSPFTNNAQEEQELSQMQETMKKFRTASIQHNMPLELSKTPLSQSARLPLMRNNFFSSFCIGRVPNVNKWTDTLRTEGEVYVTSFVATERTETAVKLSVSGNGLLSQNATKHYSATGQVVEAGQSQGSTRLEKDTYSGTLVVEADTGIIITADITRHQEQQNKIMGNESRISMDHTYKVRNKRL
jgi:hypothetical protein